MLRKLRDQLRITQDELLNDLKGAGTTLNKKKVGNTLCCTGLRSYCARKVPLLKKAHVQAHLKCANEHQNDSQKSWENGMWSDKTKIEFNLTCTFGGREFQNINPRTSSPLLNIEVETFCFEAVSLLRVQEDFTALRGR